MTEVELIAELDQEPFQPFHIYLVSEMVLDVLTAKVAHPFADSLLVLRNPTLGTRKAEGYDVIAYENIERVEQLLMGKDR